MSLNSDSTLLLAVAVHGGVLSAVLWRGRSTGAANDSGRSRVNATANRCLAALTMVAALRLIPYVLGFAGAYDAYRWLTFAPFDFTLALGPLVWGYVAALTTGKLPTHWRWHLVPPALQAAYFLVCFALPVERKWEFYTGFHLHFIEPAGLVAVLASVALYGAAAWRRYARYQSWLADNLSSREEFRLGWLRLVLIAIASTWVVIAGFFIFAKIFGPLDYFERVPAVLWLAGLVYTLGLAGWRYGDRPLPWLESASAVDSTSTDSTAAQPTTIAEDSEPTPGDSRITQRELALEWAAQTEAAGWWRDTTLTRDVLARNLGTSPRTLSRVLNEGLGQSFNEFVNRLRVQAVAAELADLSRERDLLQVAFDAGFNSKPSFNRAFKAYTGRTPSAFREDARSEASRLAPPARAGRFRDA
jgi:AraC-like DNA-binding protein